MHAKLAPAVTLALAAMLLWAVPVHAQGPVAHWPLNEGSGAWAYDAVSTNNGLISGAEWVDYGTGSMLYFDGFDDSVNCSAPSAFDIRDVITLSAWIWPEDVPPLEPGVAGKGFSSYLLTYYRTRNAFWYIGSGGNNAAHGVSPGAWSHLVGTFDGTTLRLYKNGQLVNERASSYSEIPADSTFWIGTGRNASNFHGLIADVKLYHRVVTQAEAQAEYEAGIAGRFAPVQYPCDPIPTGVDMTDGTVTVRVGPGGGTQVSWGSSYCILESTFTYPKTVIGTNAFSERTYDSEAAWDPVAVLTAADTIEVTASGAYYSIVRTIRLVDGRLQIEDHVTNLRGSPVGIVTSHYALTPYSFASTRLGYGSEEPIVYMALPDCDLGLFFRDPLSRTQFNPFAAANKAGVKMNHFGLDTAASADIEFDVYPMALSGDSLDFINRLRQDLGTNHTLLGPCGYLNAGTGVITDPDSLKAYLRDKKLKVIMIMPWLDYDPGYMTYVMPRSEYKTMMQEANAALKAADPEIKVVGCIETDWVTIYPDEIENGDLLPSWPDAHGNYHLTPAEAQIIIDAGLPHVDSAKRTEDGGMWIECYGRGGQPQAALGVYPAPGNYQAWFLMDQTQFIVDEVGLDGIYIDEFSLTWVDSFEAWDGNTVDVNPANGEITQSYIDANLVGLQPRMDLMTYCRDNGLVMIANTYASATEGGAMPTQRFAETWGQIHPDSLPPTGKPAFSPELGRSQLGTPIGLGAMRPEGDATGELLMRVIRFYLRHGMVYYYYVFNDISDVGTTGGYGPINNMFPITPVRLFEGGIIGEERTITCISGVYEWNHPDMPNVQVFDRFGLPRETGFSYAVLADGGGWSVDLTMEDWSDFGIISGDGTWQTRPLTVQSAPLDARAITGTAPGTTEYTAGFSKGYDVTLTAPAGPYFVGETEYVFDRWDLIHDPGILARYKLDEGSGDTAGDSSAYHNDAAITGAAWVPYGASYALEFDGVDDGVTCEDAERLEPGDAASVSLWVHPDVVPSGEVGLAGKGTAFYGLTFYADHKVWWYIGGAGSNSIQHFVPIETWTHVVGTFDGDRLRLYLDGALVADEESTETSVPEGDAFYIGRFPAGQHFPGRIADVKVYDRALSDAEVLAQYENGAGWEPSHAQTAGEATVAFTMNDRTTAVAQYAPTPRALHVASTPMTGVAITGTHPDTTDYDTTAGDNTEVTLTAPATAAVGEDDYAFDHWILDGAPQPQHARALTFTINAPASATAHFVPLLRDLSVYSIPMTGLAITGTHPDDTNYATTAVDNATVTLTAPGSAAMDAVPYSFAQWNVVTDLIAHYPFDDGAGDVLSDVSGRENHGAVTGAAWATTAQGSALSFDGDGDQVDCGSGGDFDLTGPVSIVAWIHPDEAPPASTEWGVAGKGTDRFLLTYYADSHCYFYIGAGGNDASGSVPAGQWSHVCGTFDGTTVRFYRNGELQEAFPSAYAAYSAGGTFWIGRRSVEDLNFKGDIADLKVYSRALTDDEIAREYEMGHRYYAGTAQTAGAVDLTFTMDAATIALAEYAITQHTLTVQSTPISAVTITGAHGGETEYAVQVEHDTEVTLEAPATVTRESDEYEFVRWVLDSAPQPAEQTTLTFSVIAAATAVAEYELVPPGRKGDFDDDGDIDFWDLSDFITVYGLSQGDPGWEPNGPIGDFDDDNDVDFWDLSDFITVYGT